MICNTGHRYGGTSTYTSIILVVLLVGSTTVLASSMSYDELCDEIVVHARAAAHYHNEGNGEQAEREHMLAFDAFERAVGLRPQEIQAFANMAVYSFNSHRFDHAIEYWKQVKKRLKPNDQQLKKLVQDKLQECELGRIGAERDAVYRGGQGNITAATELALRQLEFIDSPDTHQDIAVMLLMRTEVDSSLVFEAHRHLQQSVTIAYRGYMAAARSRGWRCHREDQVYTAWIKDQMPPRASVQILDTEHSYNDSVSIIDRNGHHIFLQNYHQGNVWHITLQDVVLFGKDGLVAAAPSQKGRCWLHLGSQGIFVNILMNVPAKTIWNKQKPDSLFDHLRRVDSGMNRHQQSLASPSKIHRLQEAVSIISYAVRSYYHWVAEALGRLLVLLKDLPDNIPIIVPKDDTSNQFITQYLELLSNDLAPRLYPYDTKFGLADLRVRVDHLHVVDWETTRDGTELQTHALPPRDLLQLTRTSMTQSSIIMHDTGLFRKKNFPLVVFASRQGERMRILKEEEKIINQLRSGLGGHAEVVIFQGESTSIRQAISIFYHADLVIGVHGGALSNTIFCKPGTAIFEIGFEVAHTQHFRHIAVALGLDYTLFTVKEDERGVGRPSVSLDESVALELLEAARFRIVNTTRRDEL